MNKLLMNFLWKWWRHTVYAIDMIFFYFYENCGAFRWKTYARTNNIRAQKKVICFIRWAWHGKNLIFSYCSEVIKITFPFYFRMFYICFMVKHLTILKYSFDYNNPIQICSQFCQQRFVFFLLNNMSSKIVSFSKISNSFLSLL